MPPELSLEELASKVDKTLKIASTLKAQNDEDKEKHEAQDEEKEEEKKAQEEEKEEEKKEARKARYNSMKKAMEEDDEKKRDAAILKAMDENKHEELKEAQEEEEKKEEKANVASIIHDKKSEFISKILTANKIFNPSKIKQIESRVKKANLSALKKEWSVIEPFLAAMPTPAEKPQQPEQFIPYFASMAQPEDIDAAQLNANSPDSAFAQLSTKELLEMTR
jgi:hypothetical protein